jgi:hypothetical protein
MTRRYYDHWIVIRLFSEEDKLKITLENNLGTILDPSNLSENGLKECNAIIHDISKSVMVPDTESISLFLKSEIEALDQQSIIGGLPTLPIFVDTAGEWDWWEIVRSLLIETKIDTDRYQIIQMIDQSWIYRTSFRLPMQVLVVNSPFPKDILFEKEQNDSFIISEIPPKPLFIPSDNGTGKFLSCVFDILRSKPWYQEQNKYQEFGLNITDINPDAIHEVLVQHEWDILVIMSDENLKKIFDSNKVKNSLRKHPPRLIIEIDPHPYPVKVIYSLWTNSLMSSYDLPIKDTALLWLPMEKSIDNVQNYINEFFLNIIHDFPLSEASKRAAHMVKNFNESNHGEYWLIANPASNQSLRLSDEKSQLIDDVTNFGKQVNPGDIDTFLKRLNLPEGDDLEKILRQAGSLNSTIQNTISNPRDTNFAGETRGFIPLAKAETELKESHHVLKQVEETLRSLSSENVHLIKKHQQRFVDVIIDQLVNEFYQPYTPFAPFLTNQRYRLGVHIGQPSRESLMVGEISPIDPLLPQLKKGKGYDLEIVVFEKDFKLLSERVKQIYFPNLGGTELVYFELCSPKKAGPANLRISVYYRNHLLQSFHLQAQISEIASYIIGLQVEVRMDFCRTARFTNLNRLKKRAISLGINQNEDCTHTLMLKGANIAEHYKLLEKQVDSSLEKFRKLIEHATIDDDGRSPRFSVLNDQQPDLEFEKQIRNLAKFGNELYQMLFQSASVDMQDQMRSLREKTNECIQIIRHDLNFSFPWTIVYDYTVPDDSSDTTPVPICIGKPLPISPDDSGQKSPRGIHLGCPHNPNRAVYCTEGFWGVRHRIEQLIGNKDKVDAVNKIEKINKSNSIWLATNLNADYATQKLKNELNKELLDSCVEYTHNSSFYDFWDNTKRPAAWIILGHLENNRIELIPKALRLTADQWLSPKTITDYLIQYNSWDQPKPMIFLMACESASTQLSDLNGFVQAFNALGASAIIGTECTVFSGLAAQFAQEIILKLWNGKETLGEAIQSFNREILQKKIPLPFVFNCVGSSDLTFTLPKGY